MRLWPPTNACQSFMNALFSMCELSTELRSLHSQVKVQGDALLEDADYHKWAFCCGILSNWFCDPGWALSFPLLFCGLQSATLCCLRCRAVGSVFVLSLTFVAGSTFTVLLYTNEYKDGMQRLSALVSNVTRSRSEVLGSCRFSRDPGNP